MFKKIKIISLNLLIHFKEQLQYKFFICFLSKYLIKNYNS